MERGPAPCPSPPKLHDSRDTFLYSKNKEGVMTLGSLVARTQQPLEMTENALESLVAGALASSSRGFRSHPGASRREICEVSGSSVASRLSEAQEVRSGRAQVPELATRIARRRPGTKSLGPTPELAVTSPRARPGNLYFTSSTGDFAKPLTRVPTWTADVALSPPPCHRWGEEGGCDSAGHVHVPGAFPELVLGR